MGCIRRPHRRVHRRSRPSRSTSHDLLVAFGPACFVLGGRRALYPAPTCVAYPGRDRTHDSVSRPSSSRFSADGRDGDCAAPTARRGTAGNTRWRSTVCPSGNVLLARLADDSEASRPSRCVRALEIKGGRWSLSDPVMDRTLGGRLRRMPVVNGLFTEVVSNPTLRPRIDVTTRPHGVATTWRQTLAWIVAVICGLGSLLLVTSGTGRPWWRNLQDRPEAVRSCLASRGRLRGRAPTRLVADRPRVLRRWLVNRPTMGVVTAGNFSNYYESFGVGLPLSDG